MTGFRELRIRVRAVWGRFHGSKCKKTRVTRIFTNFDHGGPSPSNAEIIPLVTLEMYTSFGNIFCLADY